MNKFLRYSLSLVLAFVASVTFAGTTPYKVLTFPDEGSEGKAISAYNKTWKANRRRCLDYCKFQLKQVG